MTDELTDEQIDLAMDRLARMVAAALAMRGERLDGTPIRIEREGEAIIVSVGGEPITRASIAAILDRHE